MRRSSGAAVGGAQGELRRDPLTGRWVVVAPRRGERPRDDGPSAKSARNRPHHDPGCPFCPGNEHQLPAVVVEEPGREGRWAVRVTPNRYPAFEGAGAGAPAVPERPAERAPEPDPPDGVSGRDGTAAPALGRQEVIVETPRHDRELADLSVAELETVLRTYRGRYSALTRAVPEGRVVVFRNQGRAAGGSLVHSHAQAVAMACAPPGTRQRESRMRRFHDERGRCLLCSLEDLEPGWADRRVADEGLFTAVVPWAAEAPHQIRIVPRLHRAGFGETSDEECAALARLLSRLLRALRDAAGDPAHNLLVHAPSARSHTDDEAFHWHLEIRPREGQIAGFELGSGLALNASEPTADADRLRRRTEGDR